MTALIVILCGVASFGLILFLLYIFVFARPRAKAPENKALLCAYAHRGLFGGDLPENSLGAFARACREGQGIELDVQLSRDGEVMVFHDYELLRMTGVDKKLCELDSQELRSLSLGSSEEKIPTFSEVLELVGGRVPLLIELKGEDLNSELCAKVAQVLRSYEGAYCIESFNPLLLRNVRKYLPNAFCGLLYTNVCRVKRKKSLLNLALTAMLFNFLARPDFIAYDKADRNSFFVKLATSFYNAPRFVWTLRSISELVEATENGECPIYEEEHYGIK